MLKRLLGLLAVLATGATFLLTLGFLWWKSVEPEEVFETVGPRTSDIIQKTVATGAMVPRTQVDIKSRVSGVLAELRVEPGNVVATGDLIATVKVIPDSANLSNAQSRVASARIASDDAKVQLERGRALHTRGAISNAELDRLTMEANLRGEELQAAINALVVVREGALRGSGNVATEVRSTVSGMVLAVPVKEGQSVIESNTFNDGTTIATVADMADMVFVGTVDEAEVGRLQEGMELDIKVGAVRDRRFEGDLEYISPMGTVVDGSVQFEIRAAVPAVDGVFVRAGSSANADIVLQRADEVLALPEAVVQFDEGRPYVEVEVGEQTYERREVELGLSDGIDVQILSGLTQAEKVKKPAGTGALGPRRRGR